MPVSIERYTETLFRYENPSFAEYTAVERNTACETTSLCKKLSKHFSSATGHLKNYQRYNEASTELVRNVSKAIERRKNET